MKEHIKISSIVIATTIVLTLGFSSESMAQRRGVVIRHRTPHTRLIIHRGHPIHRVLPATVVVRPPHKTVVVGAAPVFLPAVTWSRTVVALPVRERLRWQDSELIESDEGWVDTNFGIDGSGNALFLELDGKAELNFAEVTFANGAVQVVDFNDETRDSGVYKLLDFADGRIVKTVRILALSKSKDAKLTVYLTT